MQIPISPTLSRISFSSPDHHNHPITSNFHHISLILTTPKRYNSISPYLITIFSSYYPLSYIALSSFQSNHTRYSYSLSNLTYPYHSTLTSSFPLYSFTYLTLITSHYSSSNNHTIFISHLLCIDFSIRCIFTLYSSNDTHF